LPRVNRSIFRGVFAIRKQTETAPAPVKAAEPAKIVPPPVSSILEDEELKIPSWLEPLARNAVASSSTQKLIEREKSQASD